jgi:mersacidin/lichenicidin family type 2 lantibiotic
MTGMGSVDSYQSCPQLMPFITKLIVHKLNNRRTTHMKFDIARAWKDEAYRQTLSEEELHLLPANPAGELELADADLATVSGGWSQPTNVTAVNAVAGNVAAPCLPPCGPFIFSDRNNSVAVICEINIFSVNVANIALLGAVNNICTNVN